MDTRFECIVHHGVFFSEFTKLGYDGLEEIWQVDPDFWSYFEVLDALNELGYPDIDSLWYHDEMESNNIVELTDDIGTRRMHVIAELTGEVHLYVLHPVQEPDIIEDI